MSFDSNTGTTYRFYSGDENVTEKHIHAGKRARNVPSTANVAREILGKGGAINIQHTGPTENRPVERLVIEHEERNGR